MRIVANADNSAAKDREGGGREAREITDWSRKGPLPDLPGRGGRDSDRGYGGGSGRSFGDAPRGGDFTPADGERRRDPFPADDGKVRDFSNWSRSGPLSPLPQQERQGGFREGGRPGTNDGPRGEGFRDRKSSPAAWGEGRPQGSQDGSRPPRREFVERPAVDRTPTAAEADSQWRVKMRPDAPAASRDASREGSEAPSSPAAAPAAPAGRPKLNLAKRTVSEAQPSPSAASGDAKASPFGAARPIDTAAKEKEIEEKKQAALKEKKEADDKAREEKKQAAKEAAEQAEKDKETAATEAAEAPAATAEETVETENQNGEIVDDKAVKPKEVVRDAKPKPAAEGGAWRRPTNGPPKPQQGRTDNRGPRNDGARGPRNDRNNSDRPRTPRANGGPAPAAAAAAPASAAAEPETAAMEDDGWSTVSKPKKNQRGGNSGAARAIAS